MSFESFQVFPFSSFPSTSGALSPTFNCVATPCAKREFADKTRPRTTENALGNFAFMANNIERWRSVVKYASYSTKQRRDALHAALCTGRSSGPVTVKVWLHQKWQGELVSSSTCWSASSGCARTYICFVRRCLQKICFISRDELQKSAADERVRDMKQRSEEHTSEL